MKNKILLTLFLLASNVYGKTTNQVYEITAYCSCVKCCTTANQPTASGKMPKEGVTVAGPRTIPFGTKVHIEGVGYRTVQDRMARKWDGKRFDVYFASHKEALKFGIQKRMVKFE